MTGDNHVRICGQCQTHVFNLSEMAREEAEALIESKEGRLRVGCDDGRLCIRYYRRTDGTIMTADCPVGRSAAARRVRIMASLVGASLALVIGGALAVLGLARPTETGEYPLLDREPFRTLVGLFYPAPPPTRVVIGLVVYPPAAAPPELVQPPQALPTPKS